MGLVHFRVDDRLIHGIVAGYWTNHLQASRIMVIDDVASKDEMMRASLRMAAPAAVSLSVLDLEKAIHNIKNGNYDRQKVFVIAKTPVIFEKLQEAGIEISQVNMGNITYSQDRLKVAKTVSVNDVEIQALEKMSANKTSIISQLIPSDNEEDFMNLLHHAQKK